MALIPLGALPKANATKLGDTLEVRGCQCYALCRVEGSCQAVFAHADSCVCVPFACARSLLLFLPFPQVKASWVGPTGEPYKEKKVVR